MLLDDKKYISIREKLVGSFCLGGEEKERETIVLRHGGRIIKIHPIFGYLIKDGHKKYTKASRKEDLTFLNMTEVTVLSQLKTLTEGSQLVNENKKFIFITINELTERLFDLFTKDQIRRALNTLHHEQYINKENYYPYNGSYMISLNNDIIKDKSQKPVYRSRRAQRTNDISNLYNKLLIIYIPLAQEIGLAESIFLINLSRALDALSPAKKNHLRNFRFSRVWFWHCLEDFSTEIPIWSDTTLHRIIHNLQEQNLIIFTSEYNKMKFDKTFWYTINYETIKTKLKSVKVWKLSAYQEYISYIDLKNESLNENFETDNIKNETADNENKINNKNYETPIHQDKIMKKSNKISRKADCNMQSAAFLNTQKDNNSNIKNDNSIKRRRTPKTELDWYLESKLYYEYLHDYFFCMINYLLYLETYHQSLESQQYTYNIINSSFNEVSDFITLCKIALRDLPKKINEYNLDSPSSVSFNKVVSNIEKEKKQNPWFKILFEIVHTIVFFDPQNSKKLHKSLLSYKRSSIRTCRFIYNFKDKIDHIKYTVWLLQNHRLPCSKRFPWSKFYDNDNIKQFTKDFKDYAKPSDNSFCDSNYTLYSTKDW